MDYRQDFKWGQLLPAAERRHLMNMAAVGLALSKHQMHTAAVGLALSKHQMHTAAVGLALSKNLPDTRR